MTLHRQPAFLFVSAGGQCDTGHTMHMKNLGLLLIGYDFQMSAAEVAKLLDVTEETLAEWRMQRPARLPDWETEVSLRWYEWQGEIHYCSLDVVRYVTARLPPPSR